jgi:NRAMP (natural resistance-associated macrophage protein)-like metal ion transporter
LLRAGGVAALFAVVGPGVLAGLSDDDPAGITTYSILGAKFGYRLLWVLAVSTLALIVFHELGARMGVVTKKGLLALVRDHFGPRGATLALSALVVANLGTLCAEFAGVAAGLDLLAGVSRYLSVPLAAIGVSLLVLRGSFHRVEHVLLALASVFVAYIVSGFLARPDWGATARGLVVPGMPLTRDAVLVAVATLGTTLAPWVLPSSSPTPSIRS